MKLSLLPIALLGGIVLSAEEAPAELNYRDDIEPLLFDYCFECHDDDEPEAGLDLEALKLDLSSPANFKKWVRVHDRIKAHEMPPKKRHQPDADERELLLRYLSKSLDVKDTEQVKDSGRVQGRRLTRIEYEHTLHDLLSTNVPLANLLPADETDGEFETIADSQQLSHFHLNQYLQASDTALTAAFDHALGKMKTFKRTYRPKELANYEDGGNYRGPERRNGQVISWTFRLKFTGRMTRTRVPESGWYRITIKNLTGINPGSDGSVWGTLRSGSCYSHEPTLYPIGLLEGTDEAKDVIYNAWIEKGHCLELKPNEGKSKIGKHGASGGKLNYKGIDHRKAGISGLMFDNITIERVYPGGSIADVRGKLLPDIAFQKNDPQFASPQKDIERLVASFTERAFRRPTTREQVTPYIRLAKDELEASGSMIDALKKAYTAVLCSPRFLTFVEHPDKLDDHAIASRLSYLFWSSLPDQELLELANSKQLSKPETLKAQMDRLLADSKSDRFISNFTDQWLNLKEIDFTTPDPRRFREFDPILQESMVQETRAFLRKLINDDLSVRNFVHSDFAMLNTRLQTHYQIKDIQLTPGKGLQEVKVPHGGRNGLVTQGSILKVTADGSVTSPVLRGVWIGERILGLHIPPPPPNVGSIEPDIRGATSVREQLAKHRSDASCASCHAKIDPQGFALESYDPTGKWRKFYGANSKSAEVDPSGITPNGEKFGGIHQWKMIYSKKPEVLARAFAEHFLAYSTGAEVRFSDRKHIDAVVSEAKDNDYGLRSIMHGVVTSEPFLIK